MDVSIYIATDSKDARRKTRYYYAFAEYIKKNGEPEVRETFGCNMATRNQIMLEALERTISENLVKECNITVYMDCDFIAGHMGNGDVKEWKELDWKNYRGEKIANATEWNKLLEAAEQHTLSFSGKKKHSYTLLLTKKLEDYRKEVEGEQQRFASI